jgi:hypothetical protein
MSGDAFLGLDVAAARTCAAEMLTDAAQLDKLIREVDTAVDELPWFGEDRDTFRTTWRGQFRTDIQKAVDNLVRQGNELRARAARQEQVSRSH